MRGLHRPGLIVPYFRRRLRNRRLAAEATTHPEFYRRVMADDVRSKSPRGAVGTPGKQRWMRIGEMQFDYLTAHGLERRHKLLEIGCGNLRAGWRFISWLEPGSYTGVDISPEILIAANRTLMQRGLQEKIPRLMLYDGLDLGFLPGEHFDVAHAHSVFSHTPPEVVRGVLEGVGRLLKPGGFFDFTYNASDTGAIWGFLNEDYYYPTETLIQIARSLGFDAHPAEGWTYRQEKIRAIKQAAVSTDDE